MSEEKKKHIKCPACGDVDILNIDDKKKIARCGWCGYTGSHSKFFSDSKGAWH